MSALEAAPRHAELTVVTSDRESRGAAIKRRRMAHGIRSVREFSEKTGLSRDAITGAEKGLPTTSEVTFQRLEAWLDEFDHRTQLDTSEQPSSSPRAADSAPALGPGEIEVVLNGPTTKWNLHWRGHREDADLIREQVQEILRNMDLDD